MIPIKLLITDVDGVLTDGRKPYFNDSDGIPFKLFCDKDFTSIKRFKECGVETVFLSGDIFNASVARRHNIPFFYEKFDKLSAYQKILVKYGVRLDEVCYVGDDYADIPVLNSAGYSYCPSDAIREVKAVCHDISDLAGGRGVISQLFDRYRRDNYIVTNRQRFVEIYRDEISKRVP